MKRARWTVLLLVAILSAPARSSRADPIAGAAPPPAPPNLLLITADDMNWDAVGAFGCPVQGTTPNIDRLAEQGLRFCHAHVNIAVCQPSRSTLLTGRYPHRSGGEGFFHLRVPDVPTLPTVLRAGGYRVGLLGKAKHSTPYAALRWDMVHDQGELGMGRNPEVYYRRAKEFIERARAETRPFFLMANSHDPHRPFFGNDRKSWYQKADPPAVVPSRTFAPAEVTVPGMLPDLPDVRREVAEYYGSVRRCDDTVGRLLAVLEETGQEKSTLVVFLSDNGMSFPFAKTNCYLHSTRTPLIIRWPGQVEAGRVDREHLVSGVDLMPTVLDALRLALPEGMDGRSFLPLLEGRRQPRREFVFTQFFQTSGKRNYPMRCVQSARFGYIFNPWSDGERVFRNESQNGRTMRAMQAAAEEDERIAERVELFLKRVPEEFYDLENDPDALQNLIDDKAFADAIETLRTELEDWMRQTGDPALPAFLDRDSPEALDRFVAEQVQALGGS